MPVQTLNELPQGPIVVPGAVNPSNQLVSNTADANGNLNVNIQAGGGSFFSNTDESTFTPGVSQYAPTGATRQDAPTDVPDGDGAAFRITPKRAIHSNLRKNNGDEIGIVTAPLRIDPTGSTVQPVSFVAPSVTPYKLVSAATTNATSLKASSGTVYAVAAFNLNAAPRYLKVYNKATAPTVGTDTPVQVFMIPGNTSGAGFTFSPFNGVTFTLGIAFALTTGIQDSDTGAVGANELVINFEYA